MFTPEAISGKMFRRLTREKATPARETEKIKNCLNFAWLEETVSVLVSWEGKTEEHLSAIASIFRERRTVVCVPILSADSYGTDTASYCTDIASYGTVTISSCTDTNMASYGNDMVGYGTDTASYGNDRVGYGTDTVSYGTDTASYGTDTASYGSSGKKGLPGL